MELHELFLKSTGVSTDTRTLEKGNMFFALKGDNFNGNLYAQKALESGADYAIVDEKLFDDPRVVLVEDVLSALQELANYHRRQFKGPVIALTGSNGKTTTKELMHIVLATKYNTLATRGNLNNHIGVPLTLLRISDDTEIAIIEMGANHVGEIADLCKIAEPSHGLITNIGKAHIGTFGGFENIIRGKSELFDFLIKNSGVIWVNMSDPVLSNMKKRIKEPRLYPADIELISSSPFIIYSNKENADVQTKLIGEYNFINIAAAKAVGREFRISETDSDQAISGYIPENNRSQIIEKNGLKITLDAYNANPSSMAAAIATFEATEGSPKLMILGDMYELGEDEYKEHEILGQVAAETSIETWFCGDLTEVSSEQGEKLSWFKTKEELKPYFKNHINDFKAVLIKGSRGMKLEEVVDWL